MTEKDPLVVSRKKCKCGLVIVQRKGEREREMCFTCERQIPLPMAGPMKRVSDVTDSKDRTLGGKKDE